ncbi:MAG: DUF4177 domain-containing protein [Pseudomonadota bacterium]
MRWSYKTVHYELKKEGLLGSAFLDESEMELSLNEYGKAGWELVSILETQEGFIAVFKQPLSVGSQATYFAEDADDRRYEPLRVEKDDSMMVPDASKSYKKTGRIEAQVVPIDEYEIVVDEEDEDAEEENSLIEKDDIGSIRIE